MKSKTIPSFIGALLALISMAFTCVFLWTFGASRGTGYAVGFVAAGFALELLKFYAPTYLSDDRKRPMLRLMMLPVFAVTVLASVGASWLALEGAVGKVATSTAALAVMEEDRGLREKVINLSIKNAYIQAEAGNVSRLEETLAIIADGRKDLAKIGAEIARVEAERAGVSSDGSNALRAEWGWFISLVVAALVNIVGLILLTPDSLESKAVREGQRTPLPSGVVTIHERATAKKAEREFLDRYPEEASKLEMGRSAREAGRVGSVMAIKRELRVGHTKAVVIKSVLDLEDIAKKAV